MQEIKRNCNKVRMKLKTIERKIEDDERVDNGSADLRIKKSQHSMLFRKFVDVMNDYNSALTDYSDRAKKRLKDQLNDSKGLNPVTSFFSLQKLFSYLFCSPVFIQKHSEMSTFSIPQPQTRDTDVCHKRARVVTIDYKCNNRRFRLCTHDCD